MTIQPHRPQSGDEHDEGATDAARAHPRIVLITPPAFEPDPFAALLAPILDSVEVACLRLAMASRDDERLGRAADTLRALAHSQDVAIVIENHFLLAQRHGLDGVHLTDGARSVRKAREVLGRDAIVGAHCGTTRHEGLSAAESGADYVAYGPAGASALGDGSVAPRALFAWWSEMIEVPVIAEGGLTGPLVADLAPVSDFLAFGEEIWSSPDPLAALAALVGYMG